MLFLECLRLFTPAAEKAFSFPSLTSGRIFPLSLSTAVSKNYLGTGFTERETGLIKKQKDFSFTEKMKWKPADACGRRRLKDPAE
jgi:hypothetical protein